MKLIHAIVPISAACALSLVGTGATAQTTGSQAGGSAAASAQPSTQTAPSAAAGATSVTDAEVGQFVKAITAVQAISKDPATPAAEKQTKMAAAVQQTGLPPERFNQIASASQSDPALMQRIQAAATKPQG